MRILSRLAFTLLLFFLSGCSSDPGEEILRVTSFDKRVDAVVLRYGGHATVGFRYELFIVPKGENVDGGNEVVGATRVEELKLHWKVDRFLEVHFDKGRIHNFQNMWSSPKMKDTSYVVEIRLMPNPDIRSLDDFDHPDFQGPGKEKN